MADDLYKNRTVKDEKVISQTVKDSRYTAFLNTLITRKG